MDFVIRNLTKEYEDSYMRFVLSRKESLMYDSLKFRQFLTALLEDESEYLIAVNHANEVVGCLPIFFRKDPSLGTVANALPYYGGHGGPIAETDEIKEALLKEYLLAVQKRNCIASTIIGSPLEDFDPLYKSIIQPDFIDERIELMTFFPYDSELPIEDALMAKYRSKERNSIRKGIKNNVTVTIDNSSAAMDFLYEVHTENMLAVGGLPKTKKCFETIQRNFAAGEDYNIFIAEKDGSRIAAVLLFYFNGTVEYYTPAIIEAYRTFQPLAVLIYSAMQDAMRKNLEKWNWGGTGLTQKSLYDFKSKWGTTETRYYYYTKIFDKKVLQMDRAALMSAFSNYYVYPFGQVEEVKRDGE